MSGPYLSPGQLKKHAQALHELAFFVGEGEANPVTLRDFHGLFGRGRRFDAIRRDWERTKEALEVMRAPIRRVREGKEIHVVLGPGALEFAERVLNGLHSRKEDVMVAESQFTLINMEEIEPPSDWKPDPAAVELMKESIESCPIGLIHPIVLVGVAPPYKLGLGRTRYTACKALGKEKILARIVQTWGEVVVIDENLVRRHFSKEELERLRQKRDQLIADKKAKGLSNVQIGRELGINESTVRRSVSAHAETEHAKVSGADGKSYPATKPNRAEIRERRRQAKALKDMGQSIREIADTLEVSVGTVSSDLQTQEPWGTDPQADPLGVEEDDELDVEEENPEPKWTEVDPYGAAPWVCLAALEEGFEQVARDAEGTELHAPLETLEHLCRVVVDRIRCGEFESEASWGDED